MLKYYFINKFDTNLINKQDKYTTIIYRNYKNYNLSDVIKIKKYCKKKNFKFLLSNNIKQAIKSDLDGVYIPSFNKSNRHLSYSKKRNFLIMGSAHNLKEMRVKEKQGCKVIVISSIFKKNKNYLGLNKFKLISKITSKKVIALGGINEKNLKYLYLTNCFGFAGISFFE
tara:strand:+ start:140 stop:649 length:510 start_codon:yes stop_codon:yes gene_type:complete